MLSHSGGRKQTQRNHAVCPRTRNASTNHQTQESSQRGTDGCEDMERVILIVIKGYIINQSCKNTMHNVTIYRILEHLWQQQQTSSQHHNCIAPANDHNHSHNNLFQPLMMTDRRRRETS